MPLFNDSTIVHSQCHGSGEDATVPLSTQSLPRKRSIRNSVSVPSLSSLIKAPWNWAGDTIQTYRDGLSKEERKGQMEVESRKQIVYFRMQNVSVSAVLMIPGCPDRNAILGGIVRGMARLRLQTGRSREEQRLETGL